MWYEIYGVIDYSFTACGIKIKGKHQSDVELCPRVEWSFSLLTDSYKIRHIHFSIPKRVNHAIKTT